MTPGIQPSKVKTRLRKKLAMRPVRSTASGGSTTQKKYRSAFITNFSSSVFSFCFPGLLIPLSAAHNLRSPDSRADRDKDDAIAVQDFRFEPRLHRLCRDLLSNPVIE